MGAIPWWKAPTWQNAPASKTSVANDQTNNTLVTYLSGGYGPFQSSSATKICIGLLLPERLEDQYCFRTSRALGLLSFEGSEES